MLRLASAKLTLTYLTSFNVILKIFLSLVLISCYKLGDVAIINSSTVRTKSPGSSGTEIINSNNFNDT